MDVEIAQSIEENLAPWPNAWKDLHEGEYLHMDAYQDVRPRYTEAVWAYTVSPNPPISAQSH
jgi:phosphoglucomutase